MPVFAKSRTNWPSVTRSGNCFLVGTDIQPKTYCWPDARLLIAASVWLLSAGWAVIGARVRRMLPRRSQPPRPPTDSASFDRYCVTCHNQRTKASDLALDTVDPALRSAERQCGKASCGSCARD